MKRERRKRSDFITIIKNPITLYCYEILHSDPSSARPMQGRPEVAAMYRVLLGVTAFGARSRTGLSDEGVGTGNNREAKVAGLVPAGTKAGRNLREEKGRAGGDRVADKTKEASIHRGCRCSLMA